MRYKAGDKVVITEDIELLHTMCIDYECADKLAGSTVLIFEVNIYGHYTIEEAGGWCINDGQINHEATAKLNEPTIEEITLELESQVIESLSNRYKDIKEVYRWYSRDGRLKTKVILKTGHFASVTLHQGDINSVTTAITYALLKARGKLIEELSMLATLVGYTGYDV